MAKQKYYKIYFDSDNRKESADFLEQKALEGGDNKFKKKTVLLYVLNLISGLLLLLFFLLEFMLERIKFLSDNWNILGILWGITICIISLYGLGKYNSFYRKGIQRAQEGYVFDTTFNSPLIGISGFGSICASIAEGNIANILLSLIFPLICVLIYTCLINAMRKHNVSIIIKRIIISLITILFLGILILGVMLTVKRYNKNENKISSVFIQVEEDIIADEDNYKASYTAVDIKTSFVYDMVKEEMLKIDTEKYPEEVYHNIYYGENVEMDFSEWEINEAYALINEEELLDEYVLCMDDRIIKLNILRYGDRE